jgi:hypothetical protein
MLSPFASLRVNSAKHLFIELKRKNLDPSLAPAAVASEAQATQGDMLRALF